MGTVSFPSKRKCVLEGQSLRTALGPRDQQGRSPTSSDLTGLLRAVGASGRGRVCMADRDSQLSSRRPSGGLRPRIDRTYLCFCPDASSKGTEPLRGIFPEMHPDPASRDLPGHLLLDADNDTESTAL